MPSAAPGTDGRHSSAHPRPGGAELAGKAKHWVSPAGTSGFPLPFAASGTDVRSCFPRPVQAELGGERKHWSLSLPPFDVRTEDADSPLRWLPHFARADRVGFWICRDGWHYVLLCGLCSDCLPLGHSVFRGASVRAVFPARPGMKEGFGPVGILADLDP